MALRKYARLVCGLRMLAVKNSTNRVTASSPAEAMICGTVYNVGGEEGRASAQMIGSAARAGITSSDDSRSVVGLLRPGSLQQPGPVHRGMEDAQDFDCVVGEAIHHDVGKIGDDQLHRSRNLADSSGFWKCFETFSTELLMR